MEVEISTRHIMDDHDDSDDSDDAWQWKTHGQTPNIMLGSWYKKKKRGSKKNVTIFRSVVVCVQYDFPKMKQCLKIEIICGQIIQDWIRRCKADKPPDEIWSHFLVCSLFDHHKPLCHDNFRDVISNGGVSIGNKSRINPF